MCAALVAACQIASNIDRSRIPGEGGGGANAGGAGTTSGGGGSGPCVPASCQGTDTDCRERACIEGRCGFNDAPSATVCTDMANVDAKLCDGFGNCVACLGATDCPIEKPVCLQNECSVATCGDVLKNGMETDVDCGGPDCSKCENGKACLGATDCVSGFCEGAGGAAGACAPCNNGGDCAPLSCVNGVCQ